jgi:hypothetical protein
MGLFSFLASHHFNEQKTIVLFEYGDRGEKGLSFSKWSENEAIKQKSIKANNSQQ